MRSRPFHTDECQMPRQQHSKTPESSSRIEQDNEIKHQSFRVFPYSLIDQGIGNLKQWLEQALKPGS